MTYIENIFVCLAIPLLLSLLFIRGRERTFVFFLLVGMTVCLLAAYVSSFFMRYYGASGIVTVIEITPMCEETMKMAALRFGSQSRRSCRPPPSPLPWDSRRLKMCAISRRTVQPT